MKWYFQALRKYVVFTGRAQRKEYWIFFLFYFLILVVLAIVDNLTGTAGSNGLGLLSGLYVLAMALPVIAVSIRRLHDISLSGWWYLVVLIPFIGFIIMIILAARDSEPGENRYGLNPKAPLVST